MLVNILGITDDAKCYEMVRHLRWPDGVRCPRCDSVQVVKQGRDDTEPQRQRYECRACGRRFDDLTDTLFAGHHQPLRVWVLVLYLMGLNLSNEQIGKELDLDPDDAQRMTGLLRDGIVQRKPEVKLSGEVECDEVYVVAGHKGHPAAVAKKLGWQSLFDQGFLERSEVGRRIAAEAPAQRPHRLTTLQSAAQLAPGLPIRGHQFRHLDRP